MMNAFMLLMIACGGTGENTTSFWHGEFVSSDLGLDAWFLAELPSEKTIGVLRLAEYDPDACSGEKQNCPLYGAQIWRDDVGAEQVLFSWSPSGEQRTLSRYGKIASVDKHTQETRWFVDRLDFGEFSSLCPDMPSCPDPTAVAENVCRLNQPHEMQIVAVQDDMLTLWVADSRNARMLKMELMQDSNCGLVVDALTAEHVQWEGYLGVNGFDYWVVDDVEHLLLSVKSTTDAVLDGGVGKGRIMKWSGRKKKWIREWVFPPEEEVSPQFLNTPHGVTRWLQPDGQEAFLYAHSRALSDEWNTNTGGAIGVGVLVDGIPKYAYDAVLPNYEMHFPRDISLMSDDHALVTDSGCSAGSCNEPPSVWAVSLPKPVPSTARGGWSDSADELNIKTMLPDIGPLYLGKGLIFSSDWSARDE
jgi:hypothetical protein